MSLRSFAFFLIAILTFTQCDEQNSERRLPRHSGESGEILLVMNESQWVSNTGDSLRAVLEQSYPQLPQAESYFKILQFSSSEMSDLLRQHRNIVQVVIGPNSEGNNSVTFAKNKWSNGQLVFTVRAEDEFAFYELMRNDMAQLVSMIQEAELNRYQAKYKRNSNAAIAEKIAKDYNVEMLVPYDCEIAEAKKDFIWLKRERVKYLGNVGHDITQGFLVFRYPYTSDSLLDESTILAKHDEILKKYVPGPKEGSYLTTEYRFPPVSEIASHQNKFAVITRGLWRTENYFMGGPFVQLTSTSMDDQYVTCVMGFVFAPKFKKREYVREIEAILQSVKFLE